MIEELKPYPVMQDSGVLWLGVVPEHWRVERVKNVYTVIGGSTPSSDIPTYWDGDVVWVTPADVSRSQRLTNSLRKLTKEGVAACSTELVPPGSIIVTSRAPVGNVSLAETELCTNQGCKALVPRREFVDPIFGFLTIQILSKELQSLATGTTFAEISASKLAAVSIPLPSIGEQRSIVRFLDHADRLIRRYVATKRKLIKLLEEQKQVIIQRAVTRGLDPNAALKPSGVEWLGDVPAHWDVRRGKYYFHEVDERSHDGSEELMSVSHKTGVTPRSEKNITMFMAESYVGHKLCRPDDIVVNTMWGWMAALGVAKKVGIVSPSYGVYRARRAGEFRSQYLDLLLRTEVYRSEYVRRSRGITTSRLRLYPEDFLCISFLHPPLHEQDSILQWIGSGTAELHTTINGAAREIILLNEYRMRLITDVVTGKLDVRAAAAALPEPSAEPEEIEAAYLAQDDTEGADEVETEEAA